MFILGSSSAAFAVESDVAVESDTYGPTDPGTDPTLAGSSVVGSCSSERPVINYTVVLTDPAGGEHSEDVRLVLSNGSQSLVYNVGALEDGRLSGSVAWPDVSWTRGDLTATIEANPSIQLPLRFPNCAAEGSVGGENVVDPQGGAGATVAGVTATAAATAVAAPALAITGGDSAAVVPLLWAAGALVTGGSALLLVRRARRSRG
ncbi:MAG: hypothetical protein DI566_04180 [Microbacterium sp.]|nr:MAG: hypothetical protein DI566_04180 [Microbacterium sp.]